MYTHGPKICTSGTIIQINDQKSIYWKTAKLSQNMIVEKRKGENIT